MLCKSRGKVLQVCFVDCEIELSLLILDLHGFVLNHDTKQNSFEANVLFIYPLKTSENLWCSEVFRGYGNGTSS